MPTKPPKGAPRLPIFSAAKPQTDVPTENAASARHRYTVGQRLQMRSTVRLTVRHGGTCTVKALLPHEGHGAYRYRVKSDAENFERIVDEDILSPISSDALPKG